MGVGFWGWTTDLWVGYINFVELEGVGHHICTFSKLDFSGPAPPVLYDQFLTTSLAHSIPTGMISINIFLVSSITNSENRKNVYFYN